MKLSVILLTIAIAIEVWHIAYYCYFKEKYFDRAIEVTTWSMAYKKMYKSFIEYNKYFADNIELQYITPDLCGPALNMIDFFTKHDEKEVSNKILSKASMHSLKLFLIQQAIEVLYWIITVAFIFVIPYGMGIYIVLILTFLSTSQKYFNKNTTLKTYKAYHTCDSLLCIVMYLTCLCTI